MKDDSSADNIKMLVKVDKAVSGETLKLTKADHAVYKFEYFAPIGKKVSF